MDPELGPKMCSRRDGDQANAQVGKKLAESARGSLEKNCGLQLACRPWVPNKNCRVSRKETAAEIVRIGAKSWFLFVTSYCT